MPITPFLENKAFDPEIVRAMGTVFDDVCGRLRLSDRTDAATRTVAEKIIELAGTEHEPERLRRAVLSAFRLDP